MREERADKIAASAAVFAAAEKDGNRNLSDEEKERVRTLQAEITSLNGDIELAETQENNDRTLAGRSTNTHNTQEARDIERFSLSKMCRDIVDNKPQTGFEAEMSQEAAKEARDLGLTLEGDAHIPSFIAFGRKTQKRDNTVTQPTQPEDGSAVVYDDPAQPMLGLLRPSLAIQQLGARLLTGLRGDLPLPGMAQGAVATWKGEIEPLDKSNIKFNKGIMKPHRLGTYIDVSKQFLVQTSPDVDQMLRDDLNNAMNQALDIAAIYGTGLEEDNEPLGLLNVPGVYIIAGGTNGRVPTYKDIIALEASPEIINASTSNRSGYLLNSKIKGTLKTTQIVDGQALMVITSNNELNGARLVVSNIVTAPRPMLRPSCTAPTGAT